MTGACAGRRARRRGFPILTLPPFSSRSRSPAPACASSGPSYTPNETRSRSALRPGQRQDRHSTVSTSTRVMLGPACPETSAPTRWSKRTDTELEPWTTRTLAKTFDRFPAASIEPSATTTGSSSSSATSVRSRRPGSLWSHWVDQYATGACSQADGVAGSSQPTINSWVVDVSTCAGGPIVYTLILGDGLLLSMYDLGPKDLGRMLINQMN